MNALDHYNSIVAKKGLSPQAAADDTALTTAWIDTQGFGGCLFSILAGSIGDANATFAVDAKESANSDGSSSSDVAAGNLIGTEAGAAFQFDDDNEVRKIMIVPTKRYVAIVITPTGNSATPSAAYLAVLAQLVAPKYEPVTQPAS